MLVVIPSALLFAAGLGSAKDQQGRKEFSNYLGTQATFALTGEYYNRIYIGTAVFTAHPGVGTTSVQAWASVGIAHEEPGSSTGHTCYPDGGTYGQFDVPDEAVSIANDLRTASAKWTFTCTDDTTVSIDISWLASGRQYTSPFHVVSHEPFGLLTGQYFFREQAFASGTVKIADGPAHDLDLTGQSWDGLMRVQQGYIESTK
jgi:hypothetical protein